MAFIRQLIQSKQSSVGLRTACERSRATGPTQLAGLCAPQVNTAWSKGINYPTALGFRLSASPLTFHPPHRQSPSRERVSMWPGRRERQGFTDFWIKKEKKIHISWLCHIKGSAIWVWLFPVEGVWFFLTPSSIFRFKKKKIIVKFFNIVALGGNLLNRTKLADFWTI